MTITEKAAYIKGLVDGLELDGSTKEGKVLAAIIDLVSDIAEDVTDIAEDVEYLEEYIEELDEERLDKGLSGFIHYSGINTVNLKI